MYESYWQLHARPFENCADSVFYYPSEIHQGALLKLRYAIESRRGAALLSGASGSGKTLVVNALRRQLPANFGPLVHLVFPQMTNAELLVYLTDELTGAVAPANTTADETVRRLERFLIDNHRQGRHAVLVVDEAQLLADCGAMETMRLLLNFEIDSQPLLTLLLSGQPSLLVAMERMPSLEQRLGVKCLLRTFTLEETVSYVNHRLTAAGAESEIFTHDALNVLHHLTHGNPRRINRLCDLALLIGFAEEQSMITPAQLEAVSNELITIAPE